MKYICNRHPGVINSIRFNDLDRGHGCPHCKNDNNYHRLVSYGKDKITPIEDVIELFSARGLEVVTESYRGVKQPIEFICRKHSVQHKVRYHDLLRQKHGCPVCSKEERYFSYEEVDAEFTKNGYQLITESYENNKQKLDYFCLKGNHRFFIQTITFDSIRSGAGCYFCGIEAISGPNHYRYRHDLTAEDRASDRYADPLYRAWRTHVFQRDNYTCIKCGDTKSSEYNAHHKDGYNWCVEKRLDPNNGVTLCKDCHSEFHSIYGFGDNTELQFNDWMGEVNE